MFRIVIFRQKVIVHVCQKSDQVSRPRSCSMCPKRRSLSSYRGISDSTPVVQGFTAWGKPPLRTFPPRHLCRSWLTPQILFFQWKDCRSFPLQKLEMIMQSVHLNYVSFFFFPSLSRYCWYITLFKLVYNVVILYSYFYHSKVT